MIKIELEQFLKKYNTEDILNAVIVMFYDECLSKDVLIPSIEMITSNALSYYHLDCDNYFDKNAYHVMQEISANIFAPKTQELFLSVMLHVNDSNDDKMELLKSIQMQLKNMAFRGDAYMFQLFGLAEKFYEPFDKDMKDSYGFSFTTYEKLIVAAYNKYISIISFIDNEEMRLEAINKHMFCINKFELYEMFDKNEVDSLVEYLSVKIGIDNIKPVSIDDFKILYSKPIIDFGEYIYFPMMNLTMLNMPKIFHYTFIAEKKLPTETVSRYTDNRGDVIEQLTKEYLLRLFDNVYLSLKYPPHDRTFESDITTQCDNATIFAEAKGKILTLQALQGETKKIKEDVYNAIGKAYEQAVRSIKYLESGGKFAGNNDNEVELINTVWKFPLCIMADNFVSIPSEIYNYVEVEEAFLLPYAVNIYDLDIVTRECVSKEEFINYMLFRQMNLRNLSAMDELDIFGYYKKYGMKQLKCDENEEMWASDFTQEFDAKYNEISKKWFTEFTVNNLLR